MNKIIKYISHNYLTTLTKLFVLSFFYTVAYSFWLIKCPALFDHVYEAGVILSKLTSSFIAMYIFFFFTVHLKKKHDENNIKPYVLKKINVLIYDAEQLQKRIHESSGLKGDQKREDIIKEFCKKIKPNDDSPLYVHINQQDKWLNYLQYQRKRVEYYVSKIFIQMQFLDSKLIGILTKIEESNFMSILRTLQNLDPKSLGNFIGLNTQIDAYFDAIDDLKTYLNDYE